MKIFLLLVFVLFTGAAYAVTGGGTGSGTQVTGNGTGGSVAVTGGGTGVQVTGGGTGVQAEGLDPCMSGSFYDPDAPGEGINVEVLEDQVVVYFYRADGVWFVLQDGEVYQPYAGEIYDVGRGVFEPISQDEVYFSYDLLLDSTQVSQHRPIPWCLRSDCEDEMILQRLTQPIPCPAAVAVTGNGTGVQVTGNGTGGPGKKVTGGGTGGPGRKVTGNGTGGE
jgi:hypothetical protein